MTLPRVRRPTCEARSAARKASPITYTPPWKYRTVWRGSVPATVISAVGTPPSAAAVTVTSAASGCADTNSRSCRRCSLTSLSAGKADCRRIASRFCRCSVLTEDPPSVGIRLAGPQACRRPGEGASPDHGDSRSGTSRPDPPYSGRGDHAKALALSPGGPVVGAGVGAHVALPVPAGHHEAARAAGACRHLPRREPGPAGDRRGEVPVHSVIGGVDDGVGEAAGRARPHRDEMTRVTRQPGERPARAVGLGYHHRAPGGTVVQAAPHVRAGLAALVREPDDERHVPVRGGVRHRED